jgi:hypothetical protein
MELFQANQQWMSRPADERFTSLTDMEDHFSTQRANSRSLTVSNRALTFQPQGEDHKGLVLADRAGEIYAPTNWSFGQLARLAESPAGYLSTLPAEIAADALNYKLHLARDVEDIGVLVYRNGDSILKAATGPRYGRIWNADILQTLVHKFGDGVGDSAWRVPGEFGKAVEVTKDNTTLFAGDRDMFVFLANEENKIELPNRRNGQTGLMSRGFFVWNSEVGSRTFGIATFLFDYVCCNRIVWGAEGFQEITLRHSSGAPDRWLEELQPALQSYANSDTAGVVKLIEQAKEKRLDNVDEFLAQRFGKRTVESIKAVHMVEEQRPIESLWDASVAVTALARGIKFQDERVELEKQAGQVLNLAK